MKRLESCYHKLLDSVNQSFHLPLRWYMEKRIINIYLKGNCEMYINPNKSLVVLTDLYADYTHMY